MDLTNAGICIMTGGKSSRMGEDKASISLDGKQTLLERACLQMADFGCRYISVNKNQNYSFEGFESITDKYDEIGPMGGIASVLAESSAQAVLFAACDMPFYCLKDALETLRHYNGEDTDVVVPLVDGRWQPLASLYSRSALGRIREAIAAGDYKLMNVIEKLRFTEFTPADSRAYVNVNTKTELETVIDQNSRLT